MSPRKSAVVENSDLVDRVCNIQLQVFRSFFTIFCTIPCLLLVTYL
jgi:hypothetical protein